MSHQNVEDLYRSVTDAWNRGELERCVAFMTQDVAIFADQGGVEGGYRGHEEVRQWWKDVHDAFPDWNAEIVGLRAFGNDSLIAELRFTGHGGASGAPVDQTACHVIETRDGKIARISRYDTRAEALEAVGLSE
jgi:ketosteroid isomerase-like protein